MKKLRDEKITKWIYENCYDEDIEKIDLTRLDFTPYYCDVDISAMKVDGKLYQTNLKTNEIIMDNINNFEINTSHTISILTPSKKKLTLKELGEILGYEVEIMEEV